MSILRITVEWPQGRYHGAEWPPSPWRLYQAMLAGLAMARRRDSALEAALRHLEELPAPVVTAPRAAALRAVRARVPDNDADRVLALHAQGKPGAARAKAAELASLRTRRGRRFEGPVTNEWEASAETPGHFRALGAIARSVSAVGHRAWLTSARSIVVLRPGPSRSCAPVRVPVHLRQAPMASHFGQRVRKQKPREWKASVQIAPKAAIPTVWKTVNPSDSHFIPSHLSRPPGGGDSTASRPANSAREWIGFIPGKARARRAPS